MKKTSSLLTAVLLAGSMIGIANADTGLLNTSVLNTVTGTLNGTAGASIGQTVAKTTAAVTGSSATQGVIHVPALQQAQQIVPPSMTAIHADPSVSLNLGAITTPTGAANPYLAVVNHDNAKANTATGVTVGQNGIQLISNNAADAKTDTSVTGPTGPSLNSTVQDLQKTLGDKVNGVKEALNDKKSATYTQINNTEAAALQKKNDAAQQAESAVDTKADQANKKADGAANQALHEAEK